MADEFPPEEADIEALWKKQKGVDPETGQMWLTPRMERNAAELQRIWDQEWERKKSQI